MQQVMAYLIVRWLNPIIGRYVGKKSKKQFSEGQIKQILSKQYPKWWDVLYALLILGYLAISIGLFFATLFVLPKWYISYHNLNVVTTMPASAMFISLIMFFLYLFWVGLFYFTILLKFISKRFYDYMLMQQVRGGYPISLEEATTLTLKLSVVLTFITLPIIVYLFLK